MLRSIHSKAIRQNRNTFIELPRKKDEDNVGWLKRAREHRDKRVLAELLLLGSKGPVAFRLRVAQSLVRADLTPSHWSHIAILAGATSSARDEEVYEISLEPKMGFGFPPPLNGVQKANIGQYANPDVFPNIAWIELGVDAVKVHDALGRFMHNRSAFDSLELLLAWLAFAWGVGSAGNPLNLGIGIPAAAMVEAVVGAADYELTPGLASRSSCPEAVWQTIRWWQSYYKDTKVPAPSGCWTATHFLVDEYDAVPSDKGGKRPAVPSGRRRQTK